MEEMNFLNEPSFSPSPTFAGEQMIPNAVPNTPNNISNTPTNTPNGIVPNMFENDLLEIKCTAYIGKIITMVKYLQNKRNEKAFSILLLRNAIETGKYVRFSTIAIDFDEYYESMKRALYRITETVYYLDILYRLKYLSNESYAAYKKDGNEIADNISLFFKSKRETEK